MIAQYYSKNCLLLLSILCVFAQLTAQTLNVLPVMLKQNEITSLPYISVENQEIMNKVKLAQENYPVVIMQKQVFTDVYEISLKRTKLIVDLENGKALLEKKDSLSQQEIKTYIGLVDAYKRQLGACDDLNGQLNRSIMTMNTNFESAVRIVDKNLKRDMLKKAGIGLLGAGIGFTLATLLGAFK